MTYGPVNTNAVPLTGSVALFELDIKKAGMLLQGLTESIARTIYFLTDVRDARGRWTDFPLPTGESDEWVTAYVGAVMAGCEETRANIAAHETWEGFGGLHFFDGHGGWGFSSHSPEDADSTVWAVHYAQNLGLGDKLRTKAAELFLRAHITDDGAMATFAFEGDLRRFLCAGPGDSIDGWLGAHTCVTAGAATLRNFNGELLPYIEMHQQPAGDWTGYWWNESMYVTSLAYEALTMAGKCGSQAACRALAWITSRLNRDGCVTSAEFPHGSAFATALAARALTMARHDSGAGAALMTAVRWLLSNQRRDGSWIPSALLQVPPAPMIVPEHPKEWEKGRGHRYGKITLDSHSLMTTATVLDALVRARRVLGRFGVLKCKLV
jgi:hypothetical protein